MKLTILKNNIADLRAEPSHESERVSQLLFGESLKVKSVSSGFACVVQADGYTGWVDLRYLQGVTDSDFKKCKSGTDWFVTKPSISVLTKEGRNCWPYRLFYGTLLHGRKSRNGLFRVSLPGSHVYVKSAYLVPIKDKMTRNTDRKSIVVEAKKFIGIPYLWGGVTSLGFDCSGLVRSVFGRFGIRLPRDTKDQIFAGEEIGRADVRAGDLLFFDRHVGLATGRESILHASRAAGLVCIESLNDKSESYRSDLDLSFRTARRLL